MNSNFSSIKGEQSLKQQNGDTQTVVNNNEQKEVGLVLPTSTSSSQSDISDSWYGTGFEDDILMKALNSEIYKNLISQKDTPSYVETLFPRLALPPEMLTTNEFQIGDAQDQSCTDNFAFDAKDMKRLQN